MAFILVVVVIVVVMMVDDAREKWIVDEMDWERGEWEENVIEFGECLRAWGLGG